MSAASHLPGAFRFVCRLVSYKRGRKRIIQTHGNPGRVRFALRPPTRHPCPARFPLRGLQDLHLPPPHPLATLAPSRSASPPLPRWCAAGEGAREARGAGRVGCPSRRAGGLPTRPGSRVQAAGEDDLLRGIRGALSKNRCSPRGPQCPRFPSRPDRPVAVVCSIGRAV
jgi:hypothetical protein